MTFRGCPSVEKDGTSRPNLSTGYRLICKRINPSFSEMLIEYEECEKSLIRSLIEFAKLLITGDISSALSFVFESKNTVVTCLKEFEESQTTFCEPIHKKYTQKRYPIRPVYRKQWNN